MGKSSSQVVGYRYYAKFAAFIGNRIEKLIAINFDNRKWLTRRPENPEPNLAVYAPNLYGENEGGVDGLIDVFIGTPNQQPSEVYQQYLPLVSGYPYQSYLVFHSGSNNKGFYLGNSGYMKEMLLWVKRTRVRNDGREQWYEVRGDGAVVCEIGSYVQIGDFEDQNVEVVPEVSNYRRYSKFSYKDVDGIYKEQVYEDEGLAIYNSLNQNLFIMPVLNMITGVGDNTELVDYNKFIFNVDQKYKFIEIKTSFLVKSEGFNFIPTREGQLDDRWVYSNLEKGEKNDEGYTQYFLNALFKNSTGEMVYETISTGDFDGELSFIGYITGYPVNGAKFMARSESPDINPVHKIREILTDDTAMSKPESDINNANFMKAADIIYDEGLGVSWAIDEKSCIEAIEELCYHIEAGIRVNRQTGLYEMVLFRDNWFEEDEIYDIAESRIKDLSLEVMNSDDIVNQLNVTYYDRERIKNSTFSVYENGSILTMGHANAESIEFPYFMNMRNAEIVSNWKLKQFSTPVWSGSFSTGWREARKWNRYDLIRLPWSSKWNGTILVRIMKINLGNGTDNTVTIDFEEVIPYSGEMNTSIVVDESMNTAAQPPQPSINAVFEAPYYLTVLRAGQTNANLELSNNPDIGYVAAIAAKPQNNSLNALLYTDGGVSEFEQVSRLDYCDILQLDQPITETTSSFVVTGALTQTANSNNLILLDGELMGFVSFDDATKVLTVKRGVLDTVPKKHSSGSLFVFDLPDVAFDSTQYSQSEIVRAQVLTTTPSGIQDLSAIGTLVEIHARAIRPYPPANVKINGEYFPETHQQEISMTWVHRNRLQQTGGEIIGFYDVGVTPENGITYELKIDFKKIDGTLISSTTHYLGFVESYTVTSFAAASEIVHLTLSTVRNGYKCYQPFEFSVTLDVNFSEPYNLSAEYVQ